MFQPELRDKSSSKIDLIKLFVKLYTFLNYVLLRS